jgi:type III pantothenate kinase
MMLLVDMGNSSIKWAILDQDRLGPQKRLLYTDNLDNMLTQACLSFDVPLSGVWVSNVAGPQKAEILTHWIKSHWKLGPTFIKTSRSFCGINNGYKNPEELGVDRWLALIGARQLEKGMLCVVDCGTAVTLDVLSANDYHQGGLIIPGVTTMHNALFRNTYALGPLKKTLNENSEKSFLAHDTFMGITFGTLYAIIGSIEHVINSLEKQGNKVQLILTGGSASALESLLVIPYRLVPNLVLQGIKAVVKQLL